MSCATTLAKKSAEAFAEIAVKIGRTHLQDATPLTLGQEFSGYAAQLDLGEAASANRRCRTCANWRSAERPWAPVSTPIREFASRVARRDRRRSASPGTPFITAPNKFESLAAHDALVFAHARAGRRSRGPADDEDRQRRALARVGSALVASASWWISENEPGSSIMPGKINPTQSEALTMLCCQVFGNDVAVNGEGAQWQLRAQRLQAAHRPQLPAVGAAARRRDAVVRGALRARHRAGSRAVETLPRASQLMLTTALNPHIGYDKAAKIAKKAHKEGTTLQGGGARARLPDCASSSISGVKPGGDDWSEGRLIAWHSRLADSLQIRASPIQRDSIVTD